ncbi:hypothetical protein F5I97DRAFT_1931887 [Phlebopus sp. FC_14]|nr:hypothetical protein F5I97DRAFT_1931887 [Phlebopus sp. FC_14]
MFKKPLSNLKTSVGGLAPLRSSDRRKLKQRVVQTFAVSSEIGEVLVPDGLMSQKFQTYLNEPGVVYLSSEGDPLWFTVGKGSNDLIPTVYTLWKKYDLLPCVSTPASVIPVLVGGADLMVPGVVEISPASVVPPQLVSVTRHVDDSSTRGPPLAVGRLAVDINTLRIGAKGKAVLIFHSWKDHLFDIGSKAEPPADMEISAEGAAEQSEHSGQDGSLADAAQDGEDNATASTAVPVSSESDHIPEPDPAPIVVEPKFSKEEVSNILRTALLQAIRSILNSLPAASFPIPASTFYSSYILPFRPASLRDAQTQSSGPSQSNNQTVYPPIDIKHSSHKSLIVFFKVLDKQGLLVLKDIKPEPLVMNVSASHPDVISHHPYISIRDVHVREEKREKREEEERAKVKELEVIERWKPHDASGSGNFFVAGGFDSTALYTYGELKAVVNSYVAARQLINARDQSYINVNTDETLLATVAAKREVDSLEFLKREEVVQRLSEKMQSWYEIRAEGKDPTLKKGKLKPVSVVVKSRQGRKGKASTFVTGFESFFLEGEEMAEELRRSCACATSVSPIAGKAAGLEVMVQGKHIKAVTEFMQSRGVPKKWIEVADLVGKK